MADIGADDVRAFWKDRLEHGASAAEINRELAALKRTFSLAVKATKVTHKPHVPMLQENQRVTRVLR